MHCWRVQRGLSLIELVTALAVSTVMVSVLLPALSWSRSVAQATACGSNARQLNILMMSFAQDDEMGRYAPTLGVGVDDMRYLQRGGYFGRGASEVTVCPSTLNVVEASADDDSDLSRPAAHAYDDEGGHSYEMFQHVTPGQFPDGLTVDEPRQLSLRDPICASDSFIILDSDNDPDAGGYNHGLYGFNNLPDEATNNHGAQGLNVAFLDGRVAFVEAGDWVGVMLSSAHLNADSIDLVRAKQLFEPRIQWGLRTDGGVGLRYWLE